MKKWIKRIVLAVVVLVIVVLVVVYFSLNSIVRWRVEMGGTQATKLTTTLQAANLSLAGGSLELNNLDMQNVKGYTSPQFLAMKNCTVTVQSGSLFTPTVVVPTITISGLELTVEQNGLKNNLSDILSAIQGQTAAGGGQTAPGKKLSIGVIKLTSTQVHLHAMGVDTTINLGDIEIKDPNNPDGRPMKIADVVGKVLINVAKQIASSPQVPDVLKGGLKNVNQFMGDATKMIPGDLQKLPQNLGKSLQNLNPFEKKDQNK